MLVAPVLAPVWVIEFHRMTWEFPPVLSYATRRRLKFSLKRIKLFKEELVGLGPGAVHCQTGLPIACFSLPPLLKTLASHRLVQDLCVPFACTGAAIACTRAGCVRCSWKLFEIAGMAKSRQSVLLLSLANQVAQLPEGSN